MLLFFLGCRGYYDTPAEINSFLDEVTNQWWHLENEGSNLYLERDGESDGGFLWLDFFWGPHCLLDYNVEGGEWQYEPNDKFDIFYEEREFQLKIGEADEKPGCWKINYGVLYTDVVCPYLGECTTVW